MAEQAAKEPTMEEILASIRRIISEDGEPDTGISRSAPAAVAGNDDDDIVFDDDDADFPDDIDDFENVANDLAGAAPNGTDHHLSLDDLLGDDSDLAMSGHEQPGVAPSTAPSPKIQPFPQQARTETDMPATQRYQDTVLTEEKTADAAAGALGRLIASMDMGGQNTIEGLVRELLKPMIKDWLDANLPQIVETKVEAEVQRIAKMVR